tara:strand:- start:816 stop:1322 length:507 start_codon:yes stop_codon:yes gene_type:complete
MIPPFMRYLLFISLLCSTLLFSNEEKITNCTDIEDPSERLNCYDSLFRKEEIREDTVLIKPIETETKPEIQVKAIEQTKKERSFGLPVRADKSNDDFQIRDKISKVSQLASLRVDFVLENGQKWRSIEKIRRVRIKPGQEITVSEGFVSGYVLKVVDKKISIRVKRIK